VTVVITHVSSPGPRPGADPALGQEPPADSGVPVEGWRRDLPRSARLEAFARRLNAGRHERVGRLEHSGDGNQPAPALTGEV